MTSAAAAKTAPVPIVLRNRLTDRCRIHLALTASLVNQAVRDERYTTALLLFEHLHTHTQGVHHLDEILTQLRVIIVHVAAMEIAHLAGIFRLLLATTLHPALERAKRVLGECATMVNADNLIQNHLHGFQPYAEVYDWRKRRSHRAHKIGIGKHLLSQAWLFGAMLDAGCLNYVADTDI